MEQSPVTVVLLGAADAHVLDRVREDVFDFPVRPNLARAYLSDPRNLLAVAIHDGLVVGMASGITYVHPDKPLQLFINEVGVAAGYRRLGLGKRLVAALLERARVMGCTEAWVATEEDNAPARALYLALQGKEDPARAVVYTYPLGEQGDSPGAGGGD